VGVAYDLWRMGDEGARQGWVSFLRQPLAFWHPLLRDWNQNSRLAPMHQLCPVAGGDESPRATLDWNTAL
jgi:hypothetical protein